MPTAARGTAAPPVSSPSRPTIARSIIPASVTAPVASITGQARRKISGMAPVIRGCARRSRSVMGSDSPRGIARDARPVAGSPGADSGSSNSSGPVAMGCDSGSGS